MRTSAETTRDDGYAATVHRTQGATVDRCSCCSDVARTIRCELMIKAVSTFRRRDGMSVEAFQTYWRDEHPKVVLQLPGLRKYVQNHVLESQYAKGRQPFA